MKLSRVLVITIALWLAAGAIFTGCSTMQNSSKGSSAATGKGGSQLWAENCTRCHNVRSPSIYSDAEWDAAMHHMRIRANLTAEETTKILEFLKSAN